jgi:hypothetical protein
MGEQDILLLKKSPSKTFNNEGNAILPEREYVCKFLSQ